MKLSIGIFVLCLSTHVAAFQPALAAAIERRSTSISTITKTIFYTTVRRQSDGRLTLRDRTELEQGGQSGIPDSLAPSNVIVLDGDFGGDFEVHTILVPNLTEDAYHTDEPPSGEMTKQDMTHEVPRSDIVNKKRTGLWNLKISFGHSAGFISFYMPNSTAIDFCHSVPEEISDTTPDFYDLEVSFETGNETVAIPVHEKFANPFCREVRSGEGISGPPSNNSTTTTKQSKTRTSNTVTSSDGSETATSSKHALTTANSSDDESSTTDATTASKSKSKSTSSTVDETGDGSDTTGSTKPASTETTSSDTGSSIPEPTTTNRSKSKSASSSSDQTGDTSGTLPSLQVSLERAPTAVSRDPYGPEDLSYSIRSRLPAQVQGSEMIDPPTTTMSSSTTSADVPQFTESSINSWYDVIRSYMETAAAIPTQEQAAVATDVPSVESSAAAARLMLKLKIRGAAKTPAPAVIKHALEDPAARFTESSISSWYDWIKGVVRTARTTQGPYFGVTTPIATSTLSPAPSSSPSANAAIGHVQSSMLVWRRDKPASGWMTTRGEVTEKVEQEEGKYFQVGEEPSTVNTDEPTVGKTLADGKVGEEALPTCDEDGEIQPGDGEFAVIDNDAKKGEDDQADNTSVISDDEPTPANDAQTDADDGPPEDDNTPPEDSDAPPDDDDGLSFTSTKPSTTKSKKPTHSPHATDFLSSTKPSSTIKHTPAPESSNLDSHISTLDPTVEFEFLTPISTSSPSSPATEISSPPPTTGLPPPSGAMTGTTPSVPIQWDPTCPRVSTRTTPNGASETPTVGLRCWTSGIPTSTAASRNTTGTGEAEREQASSAWGLIYDKRTLQTVWFLKVVLGLMVLLGFWHFLQNASGEWELGRRFVWLVLRLSVVRAWVLGGAEKSAGAQRAEENMVARRGVR
ncbi:hypothetical protein EJ02DRAFT_207525 [Clathrospora elynae]|uniref:Uncharacterized protein n=1 Tax=Clathrospora elynae TaxID=706981 RepID=A0A6A5SRL5_9PLEO|nr:hypothetical protein EJ02DRAFT_207525 [Clathrospora elynae]